jgi:hypothetical protein
MYFILLFLLELYKRRIVAVEIINTDRHYEKDKEYELKCLLKQLFKSKFNPLKRRIKSHLPFDSITRRCNYSSR